MTDILTSNINTEGLKEESVDGAAEKFETMFTSILDIQETGKEYSDRKELFSLVQVQNQSFGTKQNAKLTMDHPILTKNFSKSSRLRMGPKIRYVGFI